MFQSHILLASIWVLYCFVHSLLADLRVKLYFEKLMGAQFKFYRISYSMFAAVSLAGIIYLQITIPSMGLFSSGIVKLLSVLLFEIPGLIIMAICIRKYFYELSGVQALNHEKLHITLQVNGLHKYMRHPLYSGTLLFVWGLFLIFPLVSNLIACGIMTIYVLVGIRLEEQKLKIEFGEQYSDYAKNVKMLIPGVV